MEEEKDTSFRVTDRRKFNPDGTPRDQAAEPEPPASASEQPAPRSEQAPPEAEPRPSDESSSGNVVSFPGEASRKREQPESEPSPRPTPPPDAQAMNDQAARAASVKAAEQAYNQIRTNGPSRMPEASFLTLVDMLAAEAAISLGLAQTPDGSKLPVDLEAARHMIDMLGMLDQKTKGNLNPEESSVLENMLGYFRMQYVGLSRKQ